MSVVQDVIGPLSRLVSTAEEVPPIAARGSRPMPDDAAEAMISAQQLNLAKIMVVDDEPVNIKAVEKFLRGFGYENFVTTSNSSQAFNLICSERPDVVLLDIMMPQVSGLDLLRQLRADARFHCLPVVILTAYCDPATKREALEAGATDFLAKPIEPNELAPRVNNVLAVKLFQDRLARRADRLQSEVRQQADALAAARVRADLRYYAGKAEIATDVLHNVGNALNSINVSVNLCANSVRELKVQSLSRAVNLLKQNEATLASFMTEDERGRVLPDYLAELSGALLQQRDKLAGEIELLTKHLEHINAVVATQQKYATLCNVTEEVSLPELVTDVEELLGGSFTRHGIEIVHKFVDTPTVWTDRQKLLQVLLNVVKNAKDSVKMAHTDRVGTIVIRLGRRNDNRAFIEISDDGVGIAQENLVKIFSHGFSTKGEGRGFGLHSCGNIMQELGGSIQAHSDGPSRGATFTLELPLKTRANAS